MDSQLSLLGDMPVRSGEASEQQILREKMKQMRELRKVELERLRRSARHLIHDPSYGIRYLGIPHLHTSEVLRDVEGIQPEQRKGRWGSWRNNILGAVYRGGGFTHIEDRASKSKGRHGSKVGYWTLPKYETLVRELLAKQANENNVKQETN